VGWCVITKNLFFHRSLSRAQEDQWPGRLIPLPNDAKLLGEIARLAEVAIFRNPIGKLTAPADKRACHCQGDGPKHGPHLNVSYRGEKGKTTGYYVPKAAQEATREGGRRLAKKCRNVYENWRS